MTTALRGPFLSGMQISTGLIPLITGTFVEALSGTGFSITKGFGTGVIQ
ncbi:hypothetical protein ACO9S2_03985 [Nitrospira sp. NS4]